MRTLDRVNSPFFNLDLARDAAGPPPAPLKDPKNLKELTVWCAEVKRRMAENKAKREENAGILLHQFLMNEVDYVQYTERIDQKGRPIRVHFWQAWMLLSDIAIVFAGRDVGKSTALKWCLEQRATNYPTGSLIVTGNSDDRVEKIWNEAVRIEMQRHWWPKQFLDLGPGAAKTRVPCYQRFLNGFELHGRPASEQAAHRIESPHAMGVVLDEAQEYSEAAWAKLVPAINPYEDNIQHGSMRKVFGVNSEGRIDNVFYHLAFRHPIYKRYRVSFPSWYNPDYNLERHVDFLEQLDGSINASRFKQTVRGMTGERQRGLFDMEAYNRCCVLGESLGIYEKRLIRVDRATWSRYSGDVQNIFEDGGLTPWDRESDMTLLSMDYGSTAPSEIGIWYRVTNPNLAVGDKDVDNRSLWVLWWRIQMLGIVGHDQAAMVDWLTDYLYLDYLSIDSTASTDKIWEVLTDPRHGDYVEKGYKEKIFAAAWNRMVPIRYQEEEPNKAMAPAGSQWKEITIGTEYKYKLWALVQHSNVLASQKVAAMVQNQQLALPKRDFDLSNEMAGIVEKVTEGRQPSYVGTGEGRGLHRFSMLRSLALFDHHHFTLKRMEREITGEDDIFGPPMPVSGKVYPVKFPSLNGGRPYA